MFGSVATSKSTISRMWTRFLLVMKVDDQSNLAAVGVERVHVVHVVDAAHLLLDWRRDRLLNRQRISARVVRLHLDFRWRDLRILRDRQRKNADATDERHQN